MLLRFWSAWTPTANRKTMSQQHPIANAFVSCSLRPEDETFVKLVEQILIHFGIQPFGTVRRNDANAQNPIDRIQQNIPDADMVVIVATPRYLQQDIGTGHTKNALSEMIHAESAMAVAFGKPVIVFAKSGTDVGGFLPNVTQPIFLSGALQDLQRKEELIRSMFENTLSWLDDEKVQRGLKTAGKVAVGGFAVFGAFKLFQWLFEEPENNDQ